MKLARIEAASEKFGLLRRSLTLCIAGLIPCLFFVQPAGAGVIPSGATVDYHPVTDTILDLTNEGAVEFRRVVIDAGITLRILLPADGAYAQIIAVDDIVLNGVVDTGSGSLDLAAGNRIVMGPGAQLSGENISFQAGNLNLGGIIDVAAVAPSTLLLSAPAGTLSVRGWNTGIIYSGSALIVAANNPIALSASTVTLAPATIPEPATWLLVLTGLALFAHHELRRNHRAS